MRVGLVCPYSFARPGGVQNHVLGLAGWLQALGHEPAILAPGAAPSASLARRGLTPDHVTSLGSSIAIPWNGSVARVSGGARTALRVREWLHSHHLDVLHLHEPITPSAALWALIGGRLPIVATFHLATDRSRVLALAGRALRPVIERIDVPLAVSRTAAGVVRRHLGLQPDIVPNGIDTKEFAGERGSFSPPRVVFLGRVAEPRKGAGVLLAAVPRIETLAGPLDLILAGPGSQPPPPGARAIGTPTDAERADLFRNADVFVAPHTGQESFGMVLVEAMAAGTPVVASALPAFVDVLTDGRGRLLGRVFPAGDAEALARSVTATLTGSGPGATELRAQAARFDWAVVGPRIVGAYEHACRLRGRRVRGSE